ncbi:MAG: 30S ribosomal protein S12 methylthiotransferase RimO, partial [Candidatus Hydrothermota bacterium]
MAIEKIFIHTLGCPKNEVDSRAIEYFLKDSECVLTLDPREAKIIILNTCGFLKEAIQESLEYV